MASTLPFLTSPHAKAPAEPLEILWGEDGRAYFAYRILPPSPQTQQAHKAQAGSEHTPIIRRVATHARREMSCLSWPAAKQGSAQGRRAHALSTLGLGFEVVETFVKEPWEHVIVEPTEGSADAVCQLVDAHLRAPMVRLLAVELAAHLAFIFGCGNASACVSPSTILIGQNFCHVRLVAVAQGSDLSRATRWVAPITDGDPAEGACARSVWSLGVTLAQLMLPTVPAFNGLSAALWPAYWHQHVHLVDDPKKETQMQSLTPSISCPDGAQSCTDICAWVKALAAVDRRLTEVVVLRLMHPKPTERLSFDVLQDVLDHHLVAERLPRLLEQAQHGILQARKKSGAAKERQILLQAAQAHPQHKTLRPKKH